MALLCSSFQWSNERGGLEREGAGEPEGGGGGGGGDKLSGNSAIALWHGLEVGRGNAFKMNGGLLA